MTSHHARHLSPACLHSFSTLCVGKLYDPGVYLRVQVVEQDSGQVALPKAGQNDHDELALVLHPLC